MSPIHATRHDLFARLAELGIATKTVDHPAVFTVGESDALERDLPGGHTKNLLLKDAKGRMFLVIAEAHASIDLKTLHKALGCARLSFAKPELLMATLGVPPGSVTAFAVMNDRAGNVEVIIDQTLMNHDLINCHPLENTATTAIARDDLMRFIRATDHQPRVVALPARGTDETTSGSAAARPGTPASGDR